MQPHLLMAKELVKMLTERRSTVSTKEQLEANHLLRCCVHRSITSAHAARTGAAHATTASRDVTLCDVTASLLNEGIC